MKGLNERGAILLHAVIFIMIMGMMYSMWLRMTMGRYIWGSRAVKSERNLHRLTAVESIVYACLENVEIGKSTCAVGDASKCFPTRYDGKSVKIKISGAPPGCAVEITLED